MLNIKFMKGLTAAIGSAVLLGVATTAHAKHVKVILLGGQSNMDGRGDADDLPKTLQDPQGNVLFYYRDKNASLTTLRPGSGADFGPELSFGRTIAGALPSQNFALIKHAVSGTDLHGDWDPATGDAYSGFQDTVADGLAALTEAGHTYEIAGMLWTQGERDGKDGRTTAQYESDLNAFIGDVRTKYGADLPFFLSRLSNGQTDIPANRLAQIRAAQDNVAESDSNAYLIDTDGLKLKPDDLHFDAAGQVKLGELFGDAYVTATAPEPASLLVFGVAGGLVMTRRR